MDDDDDLFQGKRDAVYEELRLYRVNYGGSVSQLIAAHSLPEATAELRRVWPRRTTAYIWAHAGPANDHNLKGWVGSIINPDILKKETK